MLVVKSACNTHRASLHAILSVTSRRPLSLIGKETGDRSREMMFADVLYVALKVFVIKPKFHVTRKSWGSFGVSNHFKPSRHVEMV